ncbi:hypothetical protein H9P43_002075 [Blastocladiella emersonii ATCC 22665]|nr:hypothetical protein H9P43_002075 [Blastocladiella emersonii ATCC 22665]
MNRPIVLLLALVALLGTATLPTVGAVVTTTVQCKSPVVVGIKGNVGSFGAACPATTSPTLFPEFATNALKQADRIITISMTTNTTAGLTKLLPSVKSWLAGADSAFRVYVAADTTGFDLSGCAITNATLKLWLNNVPLFTAPLGNPTFTPTQVQQLTWTASDAGQASVTKTALAAINGATALTTKVEFSARFAAKCLPVLSSLTISESTACSPTTKSASIHADVFEQLMDDAFVAFSQEGTHLV